MKFVSYSIIFFIFLINCRSSKEKIDLKKFSDIINLNSFESIKDVSSERGYNSILIWSDSLKNKKFIKNFIDNLNNIKTSNIKIENTQAVFFLGKEDAILGATGGYLFLIKDSNDNYIIDLYKGAK